MLDATVTSQKLLGPNGKAQKLNTLNSNQSSSGIPLVQHRQNFPENQRGKARKRVRKSMRPYSSQKWGYIRIIAGTILGGILGFYVMHRLENNYKEKMNERLKNYEAELRRKKQERLNEFEE